jgi:UDP-glucose 4-epimerase
MRVLVTGGAGYIGSHTVLELIEQGHEPVVVDNLVNSSRESLHRVAEITGHEVVFHEADACDTEALIRILSTSPCDAVIHFAGLKAVGESVAHPLSYYRNNLDATMAVAEAVRTMSTPDAPGRIVFSSSATVYGDPGPEPVAEGSRVGVGITNPYGWTKFMGEQLLHDVARANDGLQVIALRYFNPVGAHSSGRIGEDPTGVPNNLAPFVAQVAGGLRPSVGIFGDDYDTIDGTGVRDYIHVMDLAAGHVAALNFAEAGFHAINLGSGAGTSVRQLISAFEQAVGHPIAADVLPRRSGDVASCVADPALAARLLGWSTERTIQDAVTDAWRWQSMNPVGFSTETA